METTIAPPIEAHWKPENWPIIKAFSSVVVSVEGNGGAYREAFPGETVTLDQIAIVESNARQSFKRRSLDS